MSVACTGRKFRSTLEEGQEATIRLVVDPALDGVIGKYFDGLGEAKGNFRHTT
jgi:hypothetical protein